jgi:hypothetical protein
MLDFLNEKLEWREQRDYTINSVRDIKTQCFKNPRKKLWTGATREITNVQTIFNHISSLDYGDLPDYNFITDNLVDIYNNYEMVVEPAPIQPHAATNASTTAQLP